MLALYRNNCPVTLGPPLHLPLTEKTLQPTNKNTHRNGGVEIPMALFRTFPSSCITSSSLRSTAEFAGPMAAPGEFFPGKDGHRHQREMTRKHTNWNYNNNRWWYIVTWSMFFGMNPMNEKYFFSWCFAYQYRSQSHLPFCFKKHA